MLQRTKQNNMNCNSILRNLLIIVPFILFLLFHQNSYGQPSGFLGKRFLVGVSIPMSAGYDLKKNNFTYYKETKFGDLSTVDHGYSSIYFKIKPTLFLEFVTTRRASIQVFGRYFSDKVDVTSISTIYGLYHPTERMVVNNIAIGAKYKYFFNESINPVGQYFSLGLEYVKSVFDETSTTFISDNYNNNSPPTYSMINQSAAAITPTFSLGMQAPVGNRAILDIGIESGFPLFFRDIEEIIDLVGTISGDYSNSSYPVENWAKGNFGNNLFKSYILSFNVGISLLP